jgi:uncharacterized membrane protein YgaE (UPF0421/DUF939 family)
VFLGGLAGVLLVALPLPSLVAVGIGMILVITFYNMFRIRYSPSLPCFIVVTVCTSPEIQPMIYALGRIWDTAIGLGVGMLINTLIFPYDNSRRIHDTVESLDRELLMYLEDMFDGNDILPDAEDMVKKIDDIAQQLQLFANQKLLLKLKRQKKELETFRLCENKARQLLAHMEVLCRLETLGRLSDDNRRRLQACGAEIRDDRVLNSVMEKDVVTNYHVEQILILRQELLNVLNR